MRAHGMTLCWWVLGLVAGARAAEVTCRVGNPDGSWNVLAQAVDQAWPAGEIRDARVDGPWWEMQEFLSWSPNYSIRRIEAAEETHPWRAVVGVVWKAGASKDERAAVDRWWRRARNQPGVLVFLWTSGNTVTAARAVRVAGGEPPPGGGVEVSFTLTEAEAEGRPAVLWWEAEGWQRCAESIARRLRAAHAAWCRGDLETLRSELGRGADPLRKVWADESLLTLVAEAGDEAALAVVLEALAADGQVNRLRSDEAAGMRAAANGRAGVVRALRAAGCEFGGGMAWGAGPLLAALAHGHEPLATELRDAADATQGRLALALALSDGRLQWVQESLAARPDWALDERELAAALYAQVQAGRHDVVAWLLANGAGDLEDDQVAVATESPPVRFPYVPSNPAAAIIRPTAPWTTRALAGNYGIVNTQEPPVATGFTPAPWRNHTPLGRPMVASSGGLDRGVLDTSGVESPVLAAVRRGDLAMLRLLRDGGVPLDRPNRAGATALMIAAADGRVDLVTELLAAGASPTTAMADGWTALHFAAVSDRPPVCALLMRAGANARAEDDEGITPVMAAWRAGAFGATGWLLQVDSRALKPGEIASLLAQRALAVDALELLQVLVDRVPGVQAGAKLTLRDGARLVGARRCEAWLEQRGEAEHDVALVEASALGDRIRVRQSPPLPDLRSAGARYEAMAVAVSFVIDTDGSVIFAGVDPRWSARVRAGALATIESWQFKALRLNGRPVRVRGTHRFLLGAADHRILAPEQAELAAWFRPADRDGERGLVEATLGADGVLTDLVLVQGQDLPALGTLAWGWLHRSWPPMVTEGLPVGSRVRFVSY